MTPEGEAVLDADSALITTTPEVLALPADVTDDVESEAADVVAPLVGEADEESLVLISVGVVCEIRVVD